MGKTNSLVPSLASRASLVAQMLKNMPAMKETWVQFLGQEDPLEKEMAACWGPASAKSRDTLRMNGVGEKKERERMTRGGEALVSKARSFIFKRSFYTLSCT